MKFVFLALAGAANASEELFFQQELFNTELLSVGSGVCVNWNFD